MTPDKRSLKRDQSLQTISRTVVKIILQIFESDFNNNYFEKLSFSYNYILLFSSLSISNLFKHNLEPLMLNFNFNSSF